GRVPGAEALFHIARRRAKMDGRSVIHGGTRKEPLQIRSYVSQTRAGNGLGVLRLDRGRSANEIVRDPEAKSEVMRKIVAASDAELEHRSVTADAALETRSQSPARIKSLVGFGRSTRRSVRAL